MRRSERLPTELNVTWSRAGRRIPATVADISAHGMLLVTDEVVERDSLLQLAVQLPDRVLEMFVCARFVGATASGRGIGVEIFLIDDVGQRQWLAFYERRCIEQARARRSVAMGG